MRITILLAFIFSFGILKSQSLNDQVRFIEVTGSAEMEIEPDEIRLIIGIEEYWKEQFDKNVKYEDYTTKIPITKIETELLNDLAAIGIKDDQIITREVGNYWRYNNRELLLNKEFELILNELDRVNEIVRAINTKGINYLRIGALKHKEITKFRKQVKVEALRAAKEKAEYLLKSMNQQAGNIISIVELDSDNHFWRPQSQISNTIMSTSGNDSGNDNLRKIKLRYEIKVRFEIL